METGVAARVGHYVYQDTASTDGELAFTEALGGFSSSTRLGFNTMAKSVTDDDCATNEGFTCNRSFLHNLTTSDDGVLLIYLSEDNTLETADTPVAPTNLAVNRNADYTAATVGWELYDVVTA